MPFSNKTLRSKPAYFSVVQDWAGPTMAVFSGDASEINDALRNFTATTVGHNAYSHRTARAAFDDPVRGRFAQASKNFGFAANDATEAIVRSWGSERAVVPVGQYKRARGHDGGTVYADPVASGRGLRSSTRCTSSPTSRSVWSRRRTATRPLLITRTP